MPIPLDTPYVEPAKTKQTFKHLWVLDLQVRAHTGGEQDKIYLNICPFNETSGEKALNSAEEIRLDLWDAVANVPEAQAAMEAIFAAIPALKSYHKSKLPAPDESL